MDCRTLALIVFEVHDPLMPLPSLPGEEEGEKLKLSGRCPLHEYKVQNLETGAGEMKDSKEGLWADDDDEEEEEEEGGEDDGNECKYGSMRFCSELCFAVKVSDATRMRD